MTTVHTIGHSTRPLEDLVALLRGRGVERVIDVRTVPRSRHNPQYERTSLATALRENGIEYRHHKELGGLRRPRRDSPNGGWRNDSFRGFADYMQSPEFAEAVERLIVLAAEKPTAIMCAEAVPWRCHRSLIADALVVRGIEVLHLLDLDAARPHTLNAMAAVSGTRITYPPGQPDEWVAERLPGMEP
jgi:uncharacterized protein (DUF488 family)